MKRRVFLQGLCSIPAIGLAPTLTFGDEVTPPSSSGLDRIITIIKEDKRLNKRVSKEDIDEAISSAKRMNEILLEAIIEIGVANDKKISIADSRELNDYIFNNHYDEWVLLHGDDEEDNETGFHKVVNDGAKTKIFGKNAINRVFDGIYHLGFNTHLKNQLLNEDGNRNTSYKNIALWLDSLLREDLEAGTLANPNIKEIVGETGTGLDQIINIIYNDKGLEKKISIGDIRAGAYSANEMNKLIVESIEATNAGATGEFTKEDIKNINSFLVDNYLSLWANLHGEDKEDCESGFHRVQKDGARTKIFGKNAINRVFHGIYNLGFKTADKNRLINENGTKNTSFKKVAQWLTEIMRDDLDNQKEDLEILIPLYIYPTAKDSDGNLIWQNFIDIKNKYPNSQIIAIVNPNNGHFREVDNNYVDGIKKLVNADIKVIGYVSTDYANRLAEDVIDDIEAWSNIYKEYGVSGIFFDETAVDKDDLDYYSKLSSEAKNRNLSFTILNAGTTTDQSYIDSNIANIVVSCEYKYSKLKDNPPSTYNEPTKTTELSLLVYGMEDDKVDDLISFAREHKFKYIYFTEDGVTGNPWNTLSIYFEDEVSKSIV